MPLELNTLVHPFLQLSQKDSQGRQHQMPGMQRRRGEHQALLVKMPKLCTRNISKKNPAYNCLTMPYYTLLSQ